MLAKSRMRRLTLPRMILVSGVMHVLFIAAAVLSTYPGRATTLYRPQYQVRLVQPSDIPSLSAPQAEEEPEVAVPPPPAKEEKKEVVVPEEKKEEKTKPVPIAEDKDQKVTQPKKASTEKSTSEKKPKERKAEDSIQEAIKRVQKDIKQRDVLASKGSAFGKGLTGIEGSLEYNEYYDQIEQRVRQNWSPPEHYDPRLEDLLTVVSLSILPDGKIQQSWVEKSSGNRYFDESVMRAILKSNPLPPPPTGFAAGTVEVGLRFHSNPDYDTSANP